MKTADKHDFQTALNAGDYAGAAALAQAAGGITPDGKTQNVVWALNDGAALFDAGKMPESVAVLDTTEHLAQANDLNRAHAVVDYRYTTYDGVMTNVYKAMAFLAQGDRDNARVELNRADDRQRRAEEHFQAEIAAANSGKKPAPEMADIVAKALQSQEYRNASDNLSALAAYAPFENPFATYLRGIFLLADGDYAHGIDNVKRASQVLGPNSAASADVVWADQSHGHAAGKHAPPQVWVVFENGQSATYHELHLHLPMVTGQPMTLALPMLAENTAAYSGLNVRAGAAVAATAPAGSFDAVMASEFAKRRPLILEEAVVEVLAKNVGSALAEKSGNPLLKLVSTVAANVSTADTRSWTALPKEFQVARIGAPADGHVALETAQGQKLGDVTVPADRPSIVWVKAQQAGAVPSIQIFRF